MIPNNWPTFASALLAYASEGDPALEPADVEAIGQAVAQPSGPVVACVLVFQTLKAKHATLSLRGAQLLAGCADIIWQGPNFHGLGSEAAETVKPNALARIETLSA